jgi:hypothetical protein
VKPEFKVGLTLCTLLAAQKRVQFRNWYQHISHENEKKSACYDWKHTNGTVKGPHIVDVNTTQK